MQSSATVLFDESCPLCRAFVRFAQLHDRRGHLHFERQLPGGSQAEGSDDLCLETCLRQDTIIFLEGGASFTESDAILRILRHLSPPWSWLWHLRLLPAPLGRTAYRFVARHRYNFFPARFRKTKPAEAPAAPSGEEPTHAI